MKRMNWLLGLLAPFSLAMIVGGQGYCPPGHKHSYYGGKWCCSTNWEKDCGDQFGTKCDGGKIGPNSTCCKEDDFVHCKTSPCKDFVDGLCYNNKMNFPCIIHEITDEETDVHSLTLGKVHVIAAIGDSITSGVNILSREFPEEPFLTEHPEATYLMGGDKKYTTLPNFIMQYNKDLVGFSTKNDKGYNFAVSGEATPHLMAQADKMTKALKKHKHLNKMINIFIGHNDFCSASCLPSFNMTLMASRVIEVIRKIKFELPRSYVNVIAPFDVTSPFYYYNKHKSSNPLCPLFVQNACPCLYNDEVKIDPKEMQKKETEYYQKLVDAIENERFDTKDIAVVMHTIGMTVNVNYSLDLYSADCFHGSATGHVNFAVEMFNSLFEVRPRNVNFPSALKCPQKERPFLRTSLNSRSGERGVLYGMDTMFDPSKVNCQ